MDEQERVRLNRGTIQLPERERRQKPNFRQPTWSRDPELGAWHIGSVCSHHEDSFYRFSQHTTPPEVLASAGFISAIGPGVL
jgi:hypothetical protein